MKRLVAAPWDDLQPYLDVVTPKLEIACVYSLGRFEAVDILEYVKKNYMQMWLAFEDDELDGFIVTQVLDYPRAKELRIMCLVGVCVDGWRKFMERIGGWLPFVRQVEEWGHSIGCKISTIECPSTWELYLKDYDYRRGHVLLHKELE